MAYLFLARMTILIVILTLIIAADLREMIIPNQYLITGAVIGLILAALSPSWGWILGAVIGGGVMLAIYLVLPGMIGEGDIKLAALIGLYLGWPNIIPLILISIMAGAVICLCLVLIRKLSMQSPVPLAPFLGAGTIITIFFNPIAWNLVGKMVNGF